MLSARFTGDGSFSLHSDSFAESFHSASGALEEANSKFVLPAQLDRFTSGSSIRVLDVCFGLGYNTAALIAALPQVGAPALDCWGLELDRSPLRFHLASTNQVEKNRLFLSTDQMPPIRFNNTPQEKIHLSANEVIVQSIPKIKAP